MAVLRLKDGRWCVAGRLGFWPDEPTRRREYFGRGTAAEQAARARDAELGGRRSDRPKHYAGPLFEELAKAYMNAKRPHFSDKSQRELQSRLESTILPELGLMPALDIDHARLDQYVAMRRRCIANRKTTRVRDSTIRREITDIRAILNWAVRIQPPKLAFNLIAAYPPPNADDDVILPPTEKELQAIMEAAAPHLRRAILLAYYTGLRPGAVEMLRLTWSNVSLEANIIRIRNANKGGPRLRDVPIHPDLRAHLQQWYKQDDGRGPLIHYHGKAITKIQKSWEAAVRKAKIKRRLRPYDLRHLFITRALKRGADIGALAEIVVSLPETLRRHYQHVSRELTRQTVALIPAMPVVPSCTKVAPTEDDENV